MPKLITGTLLATTLRSRLGSLLRQVTEGHARFVITQRGRPTAALLGVSDFDDLVENLDPAFQRSLERAAKEFRAGKTVTLRQYVKGRKRLKKKRTESSTRSNRVG